MRGLICQNCHIEVSTVRFEEKLDGEIIGLCFECWKGCQHVLRVDE